MADQSAQPGCESPLPFALGPHPTLSPDFDEILEKWMTNSRKLLESLPDVQSFAFLAEVLDALEGIVHTIDEAIESLDLDDTFPPQVCDLLFCQIEALHRRHLLSRDIHNFRRALYILELLPQLCDPSNVDTSQRISCASDAFLEDASEHFLYPRFPYGLRVPRLLERLNLPSDFMPRAECIMNLANRTSQDPVEVSDCGPQSPVAHEVDWVIAIVDQVVECCDQVDQDLEATARLLAVQVMALQMRFRLLGNISDLHRSVSAAQFASRFHSAAPDLSYTALYTFAFTRQDFRECLEEDIAIGGELLKHRHQKTWVLVSAKIADIFLTISGETSNIADGEHALQICEDVLSFATGEEDRLAWSIRKLEALNHLNHLGRQVPVLEFLEVGADFCDDDVVQELQAIFLWRQLGMAAIAGNEQVAACAFHEIHARDYAHFEGDTSMFSDNSEADMLRIIEALKQECTVHAQEEMFKPFAITLVVALWRRYELSRDLQYLRDALSLRSRLGPPGLYGVDSGLYLDAMDDFNGAEWRPDAVKALASPSRKFDFQYQIPDISDISTIPEQRETASGQWVEQFYRHLISATVRGESHLKIKQGSEYERTGDDKDFQVSYREYLVRLSDAKNDPGKRYNALEALGFLHILRYEGKHETGDVERAVDWYQQAVGTFREDDETPRAWNSRTDWAHRVFLLHSLTGSIEDSRLLQAHDYYLQAAASIRNIPDHRLYSLYEWIHRCLDHDGFTPRVTRENILKACDLALSLLEEQSQVATNPRLFINSRHQNTSETHGEIRIGNLACLVEKMTGDITKTIELIEASQALVWSQIRRLRAPLGDLATVSPVLASRFLRLSQHLESRMGLLNVGLEEDLDVDPLGASNWRLNRDMNQVIEEIRTLPGFESFLQVRSFGTDELTVLTKDGPIVILLEMGVAIILHQGGYTRIYLPITSGALHNLHKSLRGETNVRDAPHGADIADEPICVDVYADAGLSDSEETLRAGRKVGRKTSLMDMLGILWSQIVKPVLEVILLGRKANSSGEIRSGEWEVPKLEDRRRIWWCCQGEFSFLPIHAAGIYSGGSPICLSDFFVSSYTPTLNALFDARARPTPPGVRVLTQVEDGGNAGRSSRERGHVNWSSRRESADVLAATQPNPGGGWKKLAQVKDELKEIIQATPHSHLVSLGDTDQPDFEGHHTSVENVLKKLPEASVLHLACHGTQNSRDPLLSGFILADAKKLSIEELMKHRLPNAHTAILSACHTASNDVDQPNEAINLSSALMFLGFSNILATKWPMNDFDGPVIARAVYEALFNTAQQSQSTSDPVSSQELAGTEVPSDGERCPTLASFSLARVVDNVARYLRVEKKVPIKRWATFVHVGI